MTLSHPFSSILSHVKPDDCDLSSSYTIYVQFVLYQSNVKCFFPSASKSHATGIFDLIHIDIWGPYATPTHKGCRYFLTVVGDCSGATWTFLMLTKQHTFQILSDFFSYVSTMFGKQIKKIRSDYRIEFFNKDILLFLSKKGVIHQSSCVDTPQQNTKVYLHLLNVSRALGFNSCLPIIFWGECYLTVTSSHKQTAYTSFIL